MTAHPPHRRLPLVVLLVGSTAWTSCSGADQPAAPEVHAIALAGGKPVKVRDTDPPGAEQGTADLRVRVLGSGFEAPARVRLLLDGDPTGIVTSEVAEFVSDKELVTTITVAEDAAVALWDVEVEVLSNRRKGIGIELFEVKTKCLDPKHCDQGGPEPNAQAAWIGTAPDDAMVSAMQGVLVKESGRTLEMQADIFTVAIDFDAVRALPVAVQDEGGTQRPIDQCVLGGVPDLSGYDASVTVEGIANIMKTAFHQDGIAPLHVDFAIGTKVLGQQHWDHRMRVRPVITTEEQPNLLNVDGTLNTSMDVGNFRWGENGTGYYRPDYLYPRVELIGGSIGNAGASRVFRISEGTIYTVGRLGSDMKDPLVTMLCAVPAGDAAIVTIDPL